MGAYKDALQISASETGARVDLAVELLVTASGVVVLGDVLALRPETDRVYCEVFASPNNTPSQHQAAITYAKEFLAQSSVSKALSNTTLSWLTVYDYGMGVSPLWHAT